MSELNLTEEQRAAVENRGGSLLVSAAAGSGKTKVLVERLFRYITEERCNVDDFLVITYTKAAAAELRSKIAAELGRRLAAAPEDRHLRAQLLRVYQADIRTVDSFCTALLRENTHLLPREGERWCLSPDFRVLDEDEAALLRERVLARVLEEFYAALDDGGTDLADTLGFGRDDRALAELVLEIYGKLQSHAYPRRWLAENRRRWEQLTAGAAFDTTDYAPVLLDAAARQARCWADLLGRSAAQMADCPALQNGYADRFLAVGESLERLARAADTGRWESARAALGAVAFPRLAPVKDADGGGEKVRAKKVWDGCRDAVRKLNAQLELSGAAAMEDLAAVAPSMAALLELTERFAEAYRLEKLRRSAADFSDQEHLALEILQDDSGSPTELGEQTAARYREILVDEYQDTNEVQNAIFRAVSRNGQNLFTVGDVKQSIYRFRLADPTIFLAKYTSFTAYSAAKEGEPRKILLSKNFRSRREILDAANFLFSNILSPQMGEMDYGEDESLHFGAAYYPQRQDCAPEFHLICAGEEPEEGEKAVKRVTAEARYVAGRIRQMLDEGFVVTDADGTLRPCRAEDIVILMRSPASRAAAYAQALAERELPCSFETAEDFFSSMEVAVVLALLEIADNPRQDVALISVLRSPLFGFSPDRLAEIRAKTAEGDFYHAVEADGGADCRAFLEQLAALRLAAREMSVHHFLWHLYNTFNVLGVFGAMDRGNERRENLIALSAQAEKLESAGYTGLFAFVTQLRRLLETGRAPQVRPSVGTGVHLMSIHKSKGLEFPVVFLTDLDRAFSRQDLSTPVLVHPTLGLGPTRVELERRIQYPTLARQALETVLTRENKAEEQRILYVAMTRAKEKLILVDSLYHAPTRLGRLAAVASCPVLPEAVANGKCFGDWLLLTLLCRPEAAPLRALAGVETGELWGGGDAPWTVAVHHAEEFRTADSAVGAGDGGAEKGQSFDAGLLEFTYPYAAAARLPAKLTATQLKGREADAEIAENAARAPAFRPLIRPRFRQTAVGLTAAEAGTATHLALQYLDFSAADVAGQVARLRDRRLLTEEQAAAVDLAGVQWFLHTPLAGELRRAAEVWREYRFTLLTDASVYDPQAGGDDQVLLQGVVDCCFAAEDGTLTVLDFKTDRVAGEALALRAEQYRPQLRAYSAAMSRVLERPVSRCALVFLHGRTVVELGGDGGKKEKAKK